MERMARLRVKVELAMRYMDDGRAFLFAIKAGWRWIEGDLKFCKRWEQEDQHLTTTERTRKVIHGSMMDLEDFLNFTMETCEDFPSGWLPTLDTDLKVNENNIIQYNFYEKPRSRNTCIHFRSAMEENAKMKILANDLTRRLLNMSEDLGMDERVKVIDDYSQKIINSGYSRDQTRKIVINGIKAYENKLELCRRGERKLHRNAAESFGKRSRKKLLDKTEWFKDKKNRKEQVRAGQEKEQGIGISPDQPKREYKDETVRKRLEQSENTS